MNESHLVGEIYATAYITSKTASGLTRKMNKIKIFYGGQMRFTIVVKNDEFFAFYDIPIKA